MDFHKFYVKRLEDNTGLSGTGIIAQGVQFGTGKCVVQWICSDYQTIVIHDNLESVKKIMCTHSKSDIVWC